MKCQWNECANKSDKVIYRYATKEEQHERHIYNVSTRTVLVEIGVCDSHLKEAQKEYPHLAEKQPGYGMIDH